MFKPILFNTSMVKAILDGRKTVTRRVVKPQPNNIINTGSADIGVLYDEKHNAIVGRYAVGDILWVRETWTLFKGVYKFKCGTGCIDGQELYALESCNYQKVKWKPSIHMPRSAARIFLKVTGIRVERLQDINTLGIRAEGIYECFMCCNKNCETKTLDKVLCGDTWIDLWDSTIKKQDLDKYGWKANPFVWVIEFERVEHNV